MTLWPAARLSVQPIRQLALRHTLRTSAAVVRHGAPNPSLKYIRSFGTSFGPPRGSRSTFPRYQRFNQQQGHWSNDPRFPKIFWIAIGGAGGYYVYHLEQTETGRWRFIDVSEAQERSMGQDASQQVLQQYRGAFLPDSDRRVQQVKRVAHRLLKAGGLDSPDSPGISVLQNYGTSNHPKASVNWRVFVINAPDEKNAFVLPDGTICVFSGIFSMAGTEDGLASIIGHEMSHQLLRHSGERMSTAKFTRLLALFLSLFGLDFSLGNTAFQFFMNLPNSRAQEAEADHVGLLLAAGACYKPEESVHVWERFQKQEEAGQVPGFLSTHPTHSNRIESLKGWLDEARRIREDRCGYTSSSYEAFRSWGS